MDPRTVFCHNGGCPARGKVGEGNIGVHSRAENRYICRECGKTFTATAGTPLYRLHKPAQSYLLVMVLLSHGCPPRAIVAAFGIDERTVSCWMARAGEHCRRLHGHLVASGAWSWGRSRPTSCGSSWWGGSCGWRWR
ncbi:MAG: hypothetical protein M3Q29_18085 [Chloroflexota bacterium]|nr:hypothetical protein [Chloroflexota bacterium]